jgi:hypothetical protein
MKLSYSDWLLEREIDETLDEGWMRNLATTAALGLAGIGGTQDYAQAPQKAQQVQQQNQETLASVLNAKFGTNISQNQIKTIKPSEVISPMYGDKYNQVVQTARKAQSVQQLNIDGEKYEIPAVFSGATMDVKKLDTPIPVIFVDRATMNQLMKHMKSNLEGAQTAKGFKASIMVNNKEVIFCVVLNGSNKEDIATTLRHELSHTTQDGTYDSGVMGKGSRSWNYYFDEKEIGVRLAALKRDYFKLTGEIADEDNIGTALKHLLSNKGSYSEDAQDIATMMNAASSKGKMKEFLLFLKSNVNSVVKNDTGKGRNFA